MVAAALVSLFYQIRHRMHNLELYTYGNRMMSYLALRNNKEMVDSKRENGEYFDPVSSSHKRQKSLYSRRKEQENE